MRLLNQEIFAQFAVHCSSDATNGLKDRLDGEEPSASHRAHFRHFTRAIESWDEGLKMAQGALYSGDAPMLELGTADRLAGPASGKCQWGGERNNSRRRLPRLAS